MLFEIAGLTKLYDGVEALNIPSLRLANGKVFGLVGPNGAGKSTTIKMLTTLLPPTSGSARVSGADVLTQGNEVRRRIGYVPQMLSADGALTGYENMLISAKLYDVPRPAERAREFIEWMGLGEAADKLVREYSGGMIRRLEVAQALIHDPRVLFLDEPTVGLDPAARRLVWDYIRRIREARRMTVLLTTHMMEEAEALCDRMAIMKSGRIVAAGTPAELKASIGAQDATLDDVFIHYAGASVNAEGDIRDTFRIRNVARRVG
jgi:ABC-2 type transport system ATP-binding protein